MFAQTAWYFDKIIKSTRSKHCDICNRCVEKFDHHCYYISNCVGKSNIRLFAVFLVCLVLYLIFQNTIHTMISLAKIEYNKEYDFIYKIFGSSIIHSSFIKILSIVYLFMASLITATFL